MNILIIGGTGKTGQEIVKQGLNQGYQITVLARNPKKITINNDNIKVFQGDVLNPETMNDAFVDQDVVISALAVP